MIIPFKRNFRFQLTKSENLIFIKQKKPSKPRIQFLRSEEKVEWLRLRSKVEAVGQKIVRKRKKLQKVQLRLVFKNMSNFIKNQFHWTKNSEPKWNVKQSKKNMREPNKQLGGQFTNFA